MCVVPNTKCPFIVQYLRLTLTFLEVQHIKFTNPLFGSQGELGGEEDGGFVKILCLVHWSGEEG